VSPPHSADIQLVKSKRIYIYRQKQYPANQASQSNPKP
jgi:hypothetical protein